MKRLSAIFLIALFLFNLFGYRLVFNYALQQSDTKLEASLDKDEYNEAELVTIKVPLSLPYQNDQVNFERVDGEIKVEGKIYKYVKRKISDGQLILLCLPDHNKMRLETAKDEFFKFANDLVQNNNSKKSDHSKAGVFKNLLNEYDTYTGEYNGVNLLSHQVYNIQTQSGRLRSAPHLSPDQPPEALIS